MDVPTTGLALPLRERDRAHRCGRATIWRATVTLAAAAAAGATGGAPLVLTAEWPTSVVFPRVLPSAFFFVPWASFVAVTTAFTVPVAIPIAITTVWAFPITVRISVTVLSVSPATVPVPIPTITVAVAMVLARGAVTFRVTVVVVMRAVCERGRRKEMSTVLEICLLVEGAPVDW